MRQCPVEAVALGQGIQSWSMSGITVVSKTGCLMPMRTKIRVKGTAEGREERNW